MAKRVMKDWTGEQIGSYDSEDLDTAVEKYNLLNYEDNDHGEFTRGELDAMGGASYNLGKDNGEAEGYFDGYIYGGGTILGVGLAFKYGPRIWRKCKELYKSFKK